MTTTVTLASRGRARGGRFGPALARGKRFDGEFLQLILDAGAPGESSLGLIVGRKVLPKAVSRNRARRLLREAFRQARSRFDESFILLRLRRAPRDPAMRDLYSEALALLERAAAR